MQFRNSVKAPFNIGTFTIAPFGFFALFYVFRGAKIRRMSKKNVIFLCAHPDDFASCVGLALKISDRYKPHVFDFTHGERGCKGMSLQAARAVRTTEETRGCAMLGIEQRFFEAVDGEAYADKSVCDAITAAFLELAPAAVFLHWPVDLHTDHVLCAGAGLEAIHSARLCPAPEIVFYNEVTQTRDFTPDYVVDISDYMEQKLEYMRCHVSQNLDDSAARGLEAYCRGVGENYGFKYAETYRAFGPAGNVRPVPSVFDGVC